MNNTLEEKQKRLAVIVADLSAKSALPDDEFIGEKGAALAEEIKKLAAESDALRKEIADAVEIKNILQRNAERQKELSKATNVHVLSAEIPERGNATEVRVKAYQPTTIFKTLDGKPDNITAFQFGKWFLGAVLGNDNAKEYCRENGLFEKAASESVNTAGGATVLPQFNPTIVALRNMYGVFEQKAQRVIMTSDIFVQPKRTGGVTSYFAKEGDTATASQPTISQVQLQTRKLFTEIVSSSELTEDTIIQWADFLAQEIALSQAQKIDDCAFNGDATSTYGNITGARERLKGLSGTIADIAGLVVGTGNLYSELTLADHHAVVGKIASYARMGAEWYCSPTYFYSVIVPLQLSVGGVTMAEVVAGGQPKFLGYPVNFVEVMPTVQANSQVCALFANFRMGSLFGDRRKITLKSSDIPLMSSDQIMTVATSRFDINHHDVGNADATAANRVTGAICGLITAAS